MFLRFTKTSEEAHDLCLRVWGVVERTEIDHVEDELLQSVGRALTTHKMATMWDEGWRGLFINTTSDQEAGAIRKFVTEKNSDVVSEEIRYDNFSGLVGEFQDTQFTIWTKTDELRYELVNLLTALPPRTEFVALSREADIVGIETVLGEHNYCIFDQAGKPYAARWVLTHPVLSEAEKVVLKMMVG